MKRLIFTLAGVSLLDERKKLLGTGKKTYDYILEREIQPQGNIDAIIENNTILKGYKIQVLEGLKRKNLRDSLTEFSAEIASLYKLRALDNKADKIILIVSQTPECAFSGIINGKFIVYRRTNKQNWDSIIFNKSNDTFSCDNVEIKIIKGLQVKKGREFASEGIENLFTFLSNKIENEGPFYNEVTFNITGGYKGTIPYLTLFGMLYQEREIKNKKIKPVIKYLYEESEDIITLPNLPIAFDLPTWRDYRGLIRTLELLPKEEAQTILKKVLPPHISGLFDLRDSKYKINPFGEELKNRYQEEKISLTPFGRDYLLLDKIEDEFLRAYLKGCINQWQHIWIGDKIPEMVEHQRGHTQRVLELAAEMLYPILEDEQRQIFQNNVDLASFIGAIWLHDLGHSGERFNLDNQEYIIKGFPSLIRDFHNLITYTIIQEDESKNYEERILFLAEVEIKEGEIKKRNNVSNIEQIIENIRIISKYHRKWTPLTPDKIKRKGKHCIKLKEAITDDKLRLLTALYRVLDACDTQIERTVDDAYIDTREMIVDREVNVLMEEKREIEKAELSLNIEDKNLREKIKSIKQKLKNLTWIFEKSEETKTKIDNIADHINYIVGRTITCPNLKVSEPVKSWLSCLDQIFFKKRQPLHYEKHKGISAVMILPNGKEDEKYKFNIIIVGSKDTKEEHLKKVLEDDIYSEYSEVKSILDQYLKFKFSYQCYNCEMKVYIDYDNSRKKRLRK